MERENEKYKEEYKEEKRQMDDYKIKFLEEKGVSNELYAIPWFLTYFATKVSFLELLLDFWDRIVLKDDPTFIFFFLVSLM